MTLFISGIFILIIFIIFALVLFDKLNKLIETQTLIFRNIYKINERLGKQITHDETDWFILRKAKVAITTCEDFRTRVKKVVDREIKRLDG